MNILDFNESSNNFKILNAGFRVGYELEEKELSIDPYWLGLWLGDGTSKDSRITNGDFEIEEFCKSYAEHLNMKYTESYYSKNCKVLNIVRINHSQKSMFSKESQTTLDEE